MKTGLDHIERQSLKPGMNVTFMFRDLIRKRGIIPLHAKVVSVTPNFKKATIRLVKRTKMLKGIEQSVTTNHILLGHIDMDYSGKKWPESSVKGQLPTEVFIIAPKRGDKKCARPTEAVNGRVYFSLDKASDDLPNAQACVSSGATLAIFSGTILMKGQVRHSDRMPV